jgi:hypothetical protein
VFTRAHIKSLATATGFTLRSSRKLDAVSFFTLLLHTVTQAQAVSLSSMVSYLSDRFGIEISKQSLDERFNSRCLKFVEAVLKEIIQDRLSSIYGDKFFSSFSSVPVKDSTKIKTPSNMSDNYPGLGGSPSGISIQYEYDLKTNRVLDLNITAATRNDQADSVSTRASIEPGSLIIRDLGYYAKATFQSITDDGAFFLSRLHSHTAVYNLDDTVVDFAEIYREMQMRQIERRELPVYLNVNGKKLFVRMNLTPVPEEVYNKRMRDRNKENKKRGYKTSDSLKALYRFTVFITNAPEAYLPENAIFQVYKLRWQCELVFKVWKSVFHIDTIHKMKENRYLCMLYMKLILIMINLQIIGRVQKEFFVYRHGTVTVISMRKAFNTLACCFNELLIILLDTRKKALAVMERLLKRLSKNHFQERKKNRTGMLEIIDLIIWLSGK